MFEKSENIRFTIANFTYLTALLAQVKFFLQSLSVEKKEKFILNKSGMRDVVIYGKAVFQE